MLSLSNLRDIFCCLWAWAKPRIIDTFTFNITDRRELAEMVFYAPKDTASHKGCFREDNAYPSTRASDWRQARAVDYF